VYWSVLTGGDQLRLCAVLADTPAMETVRLRVQKSQLTLAGLVAAIAIARQLRRVSESALVELGTGLYSARGNCGSTLSEPQSYGTLISAIAAHPDRLGIGIDEDTCAMVEGDGLLQVMGKGTLSLIQGSVLHKHSACGATDPLSLHNLRVHVLSYGDRYHFSPQRFGPVHRLPN